ncbi:MAG: rhodanese-like domain-containing protein [Gallionella sp.]|nr:rhodanese-like domain-containing protein [Gallionella sp.]MDD4946736.1 rhodanese-like domain-containing protein [Gallionella sp.]MDD5612004.1 rhodanese-like domain-containing protein [Gallionella sp.]
MNSNKIFWIIAILLGVVLVSQRLQASQGVDVKQAQAMVSQGALLLDVREPDEYAAVHAVNAKLIPLGQLSSHLSDIAAYKDKPIVVICHSGRRSAKAVGLLQEAGFTRVSNVAGGTSAWEQAGLDVVRR